MADGVELKVTLIGDDLEQQKAFQEPSVQPAPEAANDADSLFERVRAGQTAGSDDVLDQIATSAYQQGVIQSADQFEELVQSFTRGINEAVEYLSRLTMGQADSGAEAAAPTEKPQPKGESVVPRASEASKASEAAVVERDVSGSLEATLEKLSEAVQQLAENIDGMDAKPAAPTEKPQTSSFERSLNKLTQLIDAKVEQLGFSGTQIGRAVQTGTRSAVALGTRASRAVSSAGRAIGLVKPAAAGTGAGATGAAATGGGVTASAVLGPLVVVGAAAAGTALALRQLGKTVDSLARELEDLSPSVAIVRARFEVAEQMNRLDRARRIGPEAANLDAARFRINESMYEVQTKIYELLLKASPLFEGMLDGVNLGVRSVDSVLATIQHFIAQWTADPTDDAPAAQRMAESFEALSEAWKEFLRDGSRPPDLNIDPFLRDIFDADGPNPNQGPNGGGGGGGGGQGENWSFLDWLGREGP